VIAHRKLSPFTTWLCQTPIQNNLTEALNDIESSLKIIENLRTNIASPELRSSYFATVQEYYEFYIDLLMQLHKTNPNSGYDIKASEASERAITR
jgi:hypothetical protein